MNLYAKVTSERATKGQGGNDRIDIVLNVGAGAKDSRTVAIIHLVREKERYTIFWDDAEIDACPPIRATLKIGSILKGKRQKGDDDVCRICKGEKDSYESLCYDCQMKS